MGSFSFWRIEGFDMKGRVVILQHGHGHGGHNVCDFLNLVLGCLLKKSLKNIIVLDLEICDVS